MLPITSLPSQCHHAHYGAINRLPVLLLRRAPRRDRPDGLEAVVADDVVVVVEVDGGVAVARDQLDLVAHLQLPAGSLHGELAVLVATGAIAGARQVLDGR